LFFVAPCAGSMPLSDRKAATPRSSSRNGSRNFLTPAGYRRHFAPTHKIATCRPPLHFGPMGAVRSFPVFSTAIEAAMGAARNSERNRKMASIGTFTSIENGFSGSIRTLALNVKARIARIDNPTDKGPHYRVLAGPVELGAAWKKTSEQGRDYLSVKLDDPSFSAPIYATLSEIEREGGYQLIWSRRVSQD
jgi:uncharacterized protein (DUF736 family)